MVAYVAELAETKLAEGRNNFATDFIGDIELYHAHVRRAERGIRFGSHDAVEHQSCICRWSWSLFKEQGTLWRGYVAGGCSCHGAWLFRFGCHVILFSHRRPGATSSFMPHGKAASLI